MFVFMSLSYAWAASIALVTVFFVALPALVATLALFAVVQSRGERAVDRARRGRRTGVHA